MFKKKPIDPSKKENEDLFYQMVYHYFEEFFIFLKKVEPLLLILTLLIALYGSVELSSVENSSVEFGVV
jgi:hypothetical protein